MIDQTYPTRTFEPLANLCCCTARFVSGLVGNPEEVFFVTRLILFMIFDMATAWLVSRLEIKAMNTLIDIAKNVRLLCTKRCRFRIPHFVSKTEEQAYLYLEFFIRAIFLAYTVQYKWQSTYRTCMYQAQGYKKNSCSTLLSMKFKLLIKTEKTQIQWEFQV